MDEYVYGKRRERLGEDHPQTLTSARNLARDLYALGQVEQARSLDEDTWARQRRVLGEDHPEALISARNLALDLRTLGEVKSADLLGPTRHHHQGGLHD
jgi:hypothetical protein